MKSDATRGTITALIEGLGVEDIAALGIASAEEARGVVARLRRLGLLPELYAKSREKNAKRLDLHPKGCIKEAGRNEAATSASALDITACERRPDYAR